MSVPLTTIIRTCNHNYPYPEPRLSVTLTTIIRTCNHNYPYPEPRLSVPLTTIIRTLTARAGLAFGIFGRSCCAAPTRLRKLPPTAGGSFGLGGVLGALDSIERAQESVRTAAGHGPSARTPWPSRTSGVDAPRPGRESSATLNAYLRVGAVAGVRVLGASVSMQRCLQPWVHDSSLRRAHRPHTPAQLPTPAPTQGCMLHVARCMLRRLTAAAHRAARGLTGGHA